MTLDPAATMSSIVSLYLQLTFQILKTDLLLIPYLMSYIHIPYTVVHRHDNRRILTLAVMLLTSQH